MLIDLMGLVHYTRLATNRLGQTDKSRSVSEIN